MSALRVERMTAGQLRRGLEKMPRPCPAAVLYGLETRMSIEDIACLTWSEARKRRRAGKLPEAALRVLDSQPIHVASPYVFWLELRGKPMPLFGLDSIIFEAFNLIWAELLEAYPDMIWIDDDADYADWTEKFTKLLIRK